VALIVPPIVWNGESRAGCAAFSFWRAPLAMAASATQQPATQQRKPNKKTHDVAWLVRVAQISAGIFFVLECSLPGHERVFVFCNRACQTGGYDMDQMFSRFQPAALSLLRFITGLLLFQYGVAKLLKFPAGTQFDKVELFSLIGAAGSLELVLGGLLMVGLFSRIVAFILSGEMAFAYFIAHFPRGFFPLLNNGTLAIMLCFTCLYLATSGGGPYSLDAVIGKKN
jgi:putative oxidoreductase